MYRVGEYQVTGVVGLQSSLQCIWLHSMEFELCVRLEVAEGRGFWANVIPCMLYGVTTTLLGDVHTCVSYREATCTLWYCQGTMIRVPDQ